jgi:hypothetical protein
VILPDILGCVEKMRYSDHDVIDREHFPEFMPQVYMERKVTSSSGIPILEPKYLIAKLYNKRITNLL